ncbi:MAG: alpha-glucosidase [Bellilinea sp.]
MAANPIWWRDGVVYQIYPRSFADSNGDGIGDLEGVIQHLDYLAELGVEAVWYSPFYPSPDVDFGYDVSNYTDIDPKFGSLADFDRLVTESHQRGIRVILDLVLNHTSDQHLWFQESRKGKDNPYSDWYIWRDAKPDGSLPNNWEAIFGTPGWEWDAKRGQYYYHMFYPQQPDLNWRNPQVRQACLDVVRFWLDRGVDGFRLDVFSNFFKHSGLPDNPPAVGLRAFDRQKHIYDSNQPDMIPLLRELRELLDSYPERYAVGETFMPTPQSVAAYTAPGLIHAAFDFEMLHCRWDPECFQKAILATEKAMHPDSWPVYTLNNHDTSRTASRYHCGNNDARLKVAAALTITLRGTPFIYYGEEIGMRNIHVSRRFIQDRIGEKYWPIFDGRDKNRSPMQWNANSHAGFTTGKPWLPVHPDHGTRNVEAQRKDPQSLFHFYRQLIQLRKELSALRGGLFQPVTYEPRKLLAYLRQDSEQTVLVVLNFSHRPVRLAMGGELRRNGWVLALSNKHDTLPAIEKGGYLSLQGDEVMILTEKG